MPLSPGRARTSRRRASRCARCLPPALPARRPRPSCRRAGGGSGGRRSRARRAGSSIPSCSVMSRITSAVAVAVSASTGSPEARLETAQVAVGGPEVVPPLADAVRLVDGEGGEADTLERGAHRGLESLGRRVDELVLATAELLYAGTPLLGSEARVEEGGAQADPAHRVDLVLHERDERRHDQRRATQDPGRDLVGERLPGAGRHDAHAVPAGQHRVDDGLLARPELTVAEHLAQDLARRGASGGAERFGDGPQRLQLARAEESPLPLPERPQRL